MKTRMQNGNRLLDGDQTFVAFLYYGDEEITDEVFLRDGMLHSDAIKLLEMAVSALNHTVTMSGWRAK